MYVDFLKIKVFVSCGNGSKRRELCIFYGRPHGPECCWDFFQFSVSCVLKSSYCCSLSIWTDCKIRWIKMVVCSGHSRRSDWPAYREILWEIAASSVYCPLFFGGAGPGKHKHTSNIHTFLHNRNVSFKHCFWNCLQFSLFERADHVFLKIFYKICERFLRPHVALIISFNPLSSFPFPLA